MILKRLFDFFAAVVALLFFSPLLIVLWLVAAVDTSSNGLFLQDRIGRYGRPFSILKLRTIHRRSKKISIIGAILRRYKADELPQLVNIILGQMSFVGPRPDISGYYDILEGENRKILLLRPGLTSEAAIIYFNEEKILRLQDDPKRFNDNIIFPDKVRMNLHYFHSRTFFGDIGIILKTIFFKICPRQ